MIIQCAKCKTKFKIDDLRIKPEGSNVRCSKCGHIFFVNREEGAPQSEPHPPEPETVPRTSDIEKKHSENMGDENRSESIGTDNIGDDISERHQEEGENIPQEMLDMEIDHTPKDTENWEEFVSISKTGGGAADKENEERDESDQAREQFDWDNINIEEPEEAPPIPEMFEDEDDTGNEETEHSGTSGDDNEGRRQPRGAEERKLTLDTDSPDRYADAESEYGGLEHSTVHQGSYRTHTKPKGSAFGRFLSTILIAAVFIVIVTASLTILINLEFISQENVAKAKTYIQSVLPVQLVEEQARDIVITEHSGGWMNTRYGPLYVISGMIKNISGKPVHYIQIKSEFVSAGKTLYEDTVYAGNTFSENELKVSKVEDIVFKLKKKNGDIDYYDMKKLSGRNYDIKPGESIPFFAVFPYDSTVLGLKYNLQVVNYEDSTIN